MRNRFFRWIGTLNYPSYVIFFVTAKCNAACKMCFYKENMSGIGKPPELSPEEYDLISRRIKTINILGISGGEPFIRQDLSEIIRIIYKNCSPLVVDLPTNGFFTESILRQAQDIAGHCPDMVVDLQLSIDGPEKVHEDIRGLKGGYGRLKETYRGLISLKSKYKNLRVKACVVYSHYNQDHIEELFEILRRDFPEFDRVVFSVVHGSVSNSEALLFDWERYFAFCRKLRRNARVNNPGDYHSLFTMSLRFAKNNFLRKVLKNKDMYKSCGAGRKVIVIGESGKVFPCEPLWEPVGDLRRNGYDIGKILDSVQMKEFLRKAQKNKCSCHWGLPMSNSLIYNPRYYPGILLEMFKIAVRSKFNKPAQAYI